MDEYDNSGVLSVTGSFQLSADVCGTGRRVALSVKKQIKAEKYDN